MEWVPVGLQGVGMGQGSLPRDGEGRQPCGVGMKIPSSSLTPPHCHPYLYMTKKINIKRKIKEKKI